MVVMSTFALLDTASDISLISSQLARDLGLKGTVKSLTINTMNSACTQRSMCVSLSVHAVGNPDLPPLFMNEVFTRDGSFNCAPQQVCSLAAFEHLRGLPLYDVDPSQVKLLIGANAPKAHIQLDVREGMSHEPIAVQTCLGWCVFGHADIMKGQGHNANVNLLMTEHEQLEKQVERFWLTESFGVSVTDAALSMEDARTQRVLDELMYLQDGHYVVPMLWKDPDCHIPNNYGVALKRYYSLLRRLKADSQLCDKYEASVNDYIDKNYARKLSPEEVRSTSPRTWYLPHHAVVSKKKARKSQGCI